MKNRPKRFPRISEAEWEVMRVVWRRHPISTADIILALEESGENWHPSTTKTLLARLVKKGALKYQRAGRAFQYSPRAQESDCVAEAGQSFLKRVFGGALAPMLAHFVERARLTTSEVRELEQLLERKSQNQPRKDAP